MIIILLMDVNTLQVPSTLYYKPTHISDVSLMSG
jgi:hypothetical protein